MADVSPQGVKLRAAHLVILYQRLFDPLHLWRGLKEPSADGLFLDALDAMDGGERVSLGQHCEALDDRLLIVFFAVEDRPFSFGNNLLAGCALPSLAAFARETELTQVASVNAPIISTLLVRAEGTREH
jgi:hypothetical protein